MTLRGMGEAITCPSCGEVLADADPLSPKIVNLEGSGWMHRRCLEEDSGQEVSYEEYGRLVAYDIETRTFRINRPPITL